VLSLVIPLEQVTNRVILLGLDLILTLVGAGLVAVNLLLDFDFVDRAIKSGMDDKYA